MLVTDQLLYDEFDRYFFWSRLLWEKLIVEPGRPDRGIRLTVDDSELSRISGLPEAAAREDFVHAVRDVLVNYEGDMYRASVASDRIGRSLYLEYVPSVVILASCVLVAAEMGEASGFNANAYYPRYNALIFSSDSPRMPRNFDRLHEIWKALEWKLQTTYRGGFGMLRIPKDPANSPLTNRVNINYPLSQCLMRRIDLDNLAYLFADWHAQELSGAEAYERLILHVRVHGDMSRALTASLAQAQNDRDYRSAFEDLLEEMIADVSYHRSRRRRININSIASATFGTARMRLVSERIDGRHAHDIIIEVLIDGTRWKHVEDARCESSDVIGGTEVTVDGRDYRFMGSNAQVFLELNGERTTQRGWKLQHADDLIVISYRENFAELTAFAEALRGADPDIRRPHSMIDLLERFEDLVAVRFQITETAALEVPFPECLERFSIARYSRLNIDGGFRYDGGYLKGTPLQLQLFWHEDTTGGLPVVYCDGIELSPVRLVDRFEYDLNDHVRVVGNHLITSSDDGLATFFRIVDPSAEATPAPKYERDFAYYFAPTFIRFFADRASLRAARRESQRIDSQASLVIGAFVVAGDDPATYGGMDR